MKPAVYKHWCLSSVIFWIFFLLFVKLASQRSPLCLLSGQSVISYSLKPEHQRFPYSYSKFISFWNINHLSDCHMPLVDFQSAEMAIFINLIQIYSCFGDIRYANLLTQPWSEVPPFTKKFLSDWYCCEMVLHISDCFSWFLWYILQRLLIWALATPILCAFSSFICFFST